MRDFERQEWDLHYVPKRKVCKFKINKFYSIRGLPKYYYENSDSFHHLNFSDTSEWVLFCVRNNMSMFRSRTKTQRKKKSKGAH